MSNDPVGPPPREGSDPSQPAMPTGGIYIRWREDLWQEQPDGTYLLWNADTRQWEESDVQPPPEPGRTITTRECPNCGKRVRTTFRVCPHCEHALPTLDSKQKASAEKNEVGPPTQARRLGQPALVAVAVVLVVAVPLGLVRYRQSEMCNRWKAGVRALTETTIGLKGLPPGISETELYTLNENRMAGTRPGGCE